MPFLLEHMRWKARTHFRRGDVRVLKDVAHCDGELLLTSTATAEPIPAILTLHLVGIGAAAVCANRTIWPEQAFDIVACLFFGQVLQLLAFFPSLLMMS